VNSQLRRYDVLDAIRIVLALTVTLGHAGLMPFFGAVDQPNAVLAVLARGFRTFMFGPPAVIAFFLISGFCIHYPFAASRSKCSFLPFYARRYIRILAPVVCTVVLFKVCFPETVVIGSNSILWGSTLWSVVCEEIYYATYPFLNRIFLVFSWTLVLALAFVSAAIVIWLGFPATDWQNIGIIATTVTLFPVWLLGCHLADQVSSLKLEYSSGGIWLWRFAAWFTMWLALVLRFHTIFHQTISGVVIGVIYYFWIRAEIAYHRHRTPWRLLVWGGHWSYSLYLIHPLAVQLLNWHDSSILRSNAGWIVAMMFILSSSYGFYLLVERPSHKLARRFPIIRLPSHEGWTTIEGAQP
jgi:peptidoglycan/LPS O-acetylase OafA/YrhL